MFNQKLLAKIGGFVVSALFFILNSAFAETAKEAFDKGVDLGHKNRESEAMVEFTRAIELDPNYAEAYRDRGLLYHFLFNIDKAIADYTKAIEINPNYEEAYVERGLCYRDSRNYVSAIADLTKAIELNPKDDRAYAGRGTAYHDQGNYSQAIADYTKTIEINPNYAAGYNARGLSYLKQGNFNQAIIDSTKAIELNPYPNYGQYYRDRAEAYCMAKEYDKAWQDVHKVEAIGYPDIDFSFRAKLEKESGRNK